MKKIIWSFLTALIVVSCDENREIVAYEINGTLKNIPDSSVVYISENNKYMDSTRVLNEKFQFSGNLEKPTYVRLIIKNSSDYKSFWLENNIIHFEAEKGEFKEAKITGSQTQQQRDILFGRLKVVQMEMENIEDSFVDSMTEREIDSLKNQYEFLESKEISINQEYVKEFPNSLVSSYVLSVYATSWGKEKTRALYEQFSTENKESNYGQQIAKYIELHKRLEIGEQFADFDMDDQNSGVKKLSDLKGNIILLEFWASWCAPCRLENPNLVKTYDTYKSKGFEIFAVSLDIDKNSWLEAIEKDKLNWTQVSDLKGQDNKAALIYGISAIPDNFLISENGVIIGRNLRGEELNRKLSELLE
ncbi:AhpC/TSA family protein [Subsaximicrobium wynnwilliamsii]|uniref:AhpC/TSA family protein n=1 Tax=Subsaximicrobium wynnwilliamsii TaxID=291179 RepID=A0A5C6ZRV9_9FLAO|nr:AhpC/TSA family protein [Subsaximicrobium wynnwilliamsii]TXD85278.1 AhpC/TSA family protein [Subsaximicrobium wynnwilliamsii]TXD91320.1 AhpC/TSA family protein [Subsaximicrobium wynnwilliamsii]TXE04714.1 AhpC/TSA family protein [Subsaximicrobium wynnwilliamsii]